MHSTRSAAKAAAFLARVNGEGGGGGTLPQAHVGGGPTRAASGLVGQTNGPMRILAGEAGREHVAIIRNFREVAMPRVGALADAGHRWPAASQSTPTSSSCSATATAAAWMPSSASSHRTGGRR
jgi:hypothetical protein